MIEYLPRDFFYANKEIIHTINWLNRSDFTNYEWEESKEINIYRNVYKIDGIIFEEHSPLFWKYVEKAQLWEKLSE